MPSTDFDAMLDKIDHALSTWETIKGAHGLSPELIEEGKRIIQEAKDAHNG